MVIFCDYYGSHSGTPTSSVFFVLKPRIFWIHHFKKLTSMWKHVHWTSISLAFTQHHKWQKHNGRRESGWNHTRLNWCKCKGNQEKLWISYRHVDLTCNFCGLSRTRWYFTMKIWWFVDLPCEQMKICAGLYIYIIYTVSTPNQSSKKRNKTKRISSIAAMHSVPSEHAKYA